MLFLRSNLFFLLTGLMLGLMLGLMQVGPLQAQYVINGDAVNINGCYRLTEAQNSQSGSVWYLDQVNINEPFELYVDIFLGCKDADGADGMAFVLQQVSNSVGSSGGGIGYQGISPSFAVEMDTWQNVDVNDPSYDHIAFMSQGVIDHQATNNIAGPVQILAGQNNAEDCLEHKFRVSWNPDSLLFKVWIDCDLRLQYTGDLINTFFNGDPNVFWGFTAATGGFNNEHRFCLDYISFTEAPRDTTICQGQSVPLSVGTGASFLWGPAAGLDDPTSPTPIATPLTTTTYGVTVTDACGQIRTDSVTITVVEPLTDLLNDTYYLCDDGPLVVSAETEGGSYLWSNGSTNSAIAITQVGSYSVTITNACGSVTETFIVMPQEPISLTIQNIWCAGDSTGLAEAYYGNSAPYEFLWFQDNTLIQVDNVPINNSQLANLGPGNYSLIAMDGAGCRDTLAFSIQEPPVLVGNLLGQQNIVCGGANTGSISLSASGGTPPYQFSSGQGGFQTSGQLTGLGAGTYQTIVQDANGCEDTVVVTLTENPLVTLAVQTQANVACNGGSTGFVELLAGGGIPPFQYSLDGGPLQSSATFSNLTAGTYTFLVQDDSACSQTLQLTITEPSPLQVLVDSQTNVLCNGQSNGSLTLTASGGVPGYVFSLDGSPFSPDSVFDNLFPGTYQISVQDDSACVHTATVQITEPSPVQLAASITDVSCFGGDDGLVVLAASGGVAPYNVGFLGGILSPTDSFPGLAAGNYSMTMVDANGCFDTLIVSVNEPPLLEVSIVNRQDVDCLGNATGVLTASGNGGTLPYTYAIDGQTFGIYPSFDSLFAGFYTITIQDSQGCVASVDTIVTTPTGLVAGIDTLIDVACFGDSTGSLTLIGQGGTQPYQFTLDGINFFSTPGLSNLASQTDTVTLVDDNGCIVPIPFTISEPPLLQSVIVDQAEVDCFGDSTGFLQISTQGGVMPYLFGLESTGSLGMDSLLTEIPVGLDTVRIEDANGCVNRIPIEITEPPLLILDLVSQQNVDCFGNANGLVELNASGGSGLYQFQQDTLPTQPSGLFAPLDTGFYQFSVMDDSGCVALLNLEITQPDSLVLDSLEVLDIACFGDSSGWIEVEALGGTGPFAYSIAGIGVNDSGFFENLAAGSFLIEVVDDSGCVANQLISLTEPPELQLQVSELQPVDCFGNENGQITVSVQGGVPEYLISFEGQSVGSQTIFEDLGPGFYDVMVQDQNGCLDSLIDLEMTEPDTLSGTLTGRDISCHSGSDGQIALDMQGGVSPYEITWSSMPIQTGPVAVDLAAGDYEVRVLDANGCLWDNSLTLTQPDTLLLSLLETTAAFCNWENGRAIVDAQGGTLPYIFSWPGYPDIQGPTADAILGNTYVVEVSDSLGCIDTLSVFVGNVPPAAPAFSMFPADSLPILLSQANIQFQNETEGAVEYSWDFGFGGNLSTEINPEFTYPEAGTYTVTLTALNSFFVCPTEVSKTFTIIPDGALFFPNAFSPNEDGRNDVYLMGGEGVIWLEMIIFNRWGREITRLQSLTDGWNGRTASGQPAPEGVYTFVVRAGLNNGTEIERGGTITLIR